MPAVFQIRVAPEALALNAKLVVLKDTTLFVDEQLWRLCRRVGLLDAEELISWLDTYPDAAYNELLLVDPRVFDNTVRYLREIVYNKSEEPSLPQVSFGARKPEGEA